MRAHLRWSAFASMLVLGACVAAAQAGRPDKTGPTQPAGSPPPVQSSTTSGQNNPENENVHDTGHVKQPHHHRAARKPASSDANGRVDSRGSGNGKQTQPQ